jgi:amino acid transporter, AAT family
VSLVAPRSAYILMVSVSAFGAMFTWLMIFVTHYFFRRSRTKEARGAFRMPGFPATTLLGATLMSAVLVTSAFTREFRATLLFGIPFLGILGLAFRCLSRRRHAGGAGA